MSAPRTRSYTLHIQRILADAGYDVAIDGYWGPKTETAYQRWVGGGGEDAAAQPQAAPSADAIEPASKPDWKSGTVIFLAVGICAQIAKHFWPDVDIDVSGVANDIADTITLLSMAGAWWRRRRATAPLRIRRAGAAVREPVERLPVPADDRRPAASADAGGRVQGGYWDSDRGPLGD